MFYAIPEELQYGAFVGNIAKDLGLGAGKMSSRKLRIASTDSNQYFFANVQNGDLLVNKRIDREELCGEQPTCYLNLEVIMENPLELHNIKVEIQDINDNSPLFSVKEINFNILETASLGSRYQLESAQDIDVGINSLRSYALSASDYFSLDTQTHSDGSKVAELVLEKQLDREKLSLINVQVTAFDGGVPEKSDTADIIITVLDANDNAPNFEQSVYKLRFLEDTPVGTLVIKLNATDLDEGPNGEILYSFSSRTPSKVLSMFNIDPRTGEISVKKQLEFKENAVYEIVVQAKDGGVIPLTSYCKVLVDVIDVNNNVPEVIISSLNSPIQEDAVPGTVVALVTVTDGDSGVNGQVQCEITRNIPFRIRSLGNYYTIVTDGVLNRETVSEYNITITATDLGSPALSSEKTIGVQISDVNDSPPQFTQEVYTVFVSENNTPGDPIYQVAASDNDVGLNGEVSYSILESQVKDQPVTMYVSIDRDSGVIFSQTAFDFEELRDFKIYVQAEDRGFPSLTASVTVNVVIMDQNDNSPVFLHPQTKGGSLAVEMIPRSAAVGYLVTKVITADVDTGQNAWLSYQLIQATDPSLISLSPHTGEIRTARPIKNTDSAKQKLVVQVKDDGKPSLSATVTIGLLLTDAFPQVLPDFNDKLENRETLTDLNLYLIITLGSLSFVFFGLLVLLTAYKCYRYRNRYSYTCCFGTCCDNDFEDYKLNYQLPPNCALPPDFIDFTGTGTRSQIYQCRNSMVANSRNGTLLVLRGCSPPGHGSITRTATAKEPDWLSQVQNTNDNTVNASAEVCGMSCMPKT